MSTAHAAEPRGLPPLEYELFRRLIRDAFGLDYPPSKRELLRARLDVRLQANGLRRYGEYYRLLSFESRAANEWRLFAEAITNNETYFFREGRQLTALATLLPDLARDSRDKVRVLSAGCSSGEEVYGLAMVLSSCLPPGTGFEVRGVDLSEAKLGEARQGRYFSKSFHADEPAPLGIRVDDFLAREADGASSVRPFLRDRVSFHRGNLAEPHSVRGLGAFDVVFCRNVLIYADEGAVGRFVESLAALVRPGGHLFLGHSDALDGPGPPFRLARVGDLFAYVNGP